MATNMVVEGTGAHTALITTRGFRDILELRRISRHDRADLYDLQFENPEPLVQRRWRLEVNERLRHDGTIDVPLNIDELHQIADQLRKGKIEAVAICFLHSYTNPIHEQQAVSILRDLLPECFITASHEVNPEMQEYERVSSTVMNALLGPVCARYIRNFEQQLNNEGFNGELLFMQSNGGLASTQMVSSKPIVLLESGPAGGVSAAVRNSEQANLPGVLVGDMGGTTFDVSLVRESRPELRTQSLLHTHAVRVPTIDIDSIGAGGGSIAWIDSGGGVRIGPESAGADPGPACYGKGGTRPTVTDCNLVLGYVDPNSFLGGEFKLDVEAAHKAVEIHLAGPLGVSVLEAAWTVRAVANVLMAQAMRLMTVERGYDPRELSYMCYGGAGPVHAIDLAEELDIKEVIVPPLPGLFSALGMIVADRQFDGQTAIEAELHTLSPEQIQTGFSALLQQATEAFGTRYAMSDIKVNYRADCRYAGQPANISVDIPSDLATGKPAQLLEHMQCEFERNHKRMWNFIKPDQPIVLVNLRLQATIPTGWRGEFNIATTTENDITSHQTRHVYIDGAMQAVPVYRRTSIGLGTSLNGPAIIEEQSSCLVIKPGQTARADTTGNLRITL
jgi:N-methylhydantoinase A